MVSGSHGDERASLLALAVVLDAASSDAIEAAHLALTGLERDLRSSPITVEVANVIGAVSSTLRHVLARR